MGQSYRNEKLSFYQSINKTSEPITAATSQLTCFQLNTFLNVLLFKYKIVFNNSNRHNLARKKINRNVT